MRCVKRAIRGFPGKGSQLAAKAEENKVLYQLYSMWYNPSMAKKRTKLLTDQLRRAIDDSGITRYRIAKDAGINESALARFYNGHRGLSMNALNALGKYLKLTIVLGRKVPKWKGK